MIRSGRVVALALLAAGCGRREPAPPPPPAFARPAGSVSYGATAADPYRALLDEEFRERRALHPHLPAGLSMREFWVPATTTRADVAAAYAKAPAGWTPDPAPPFGVDPAEPAARTVYALAYRKDGRHLQVVGVERQPGLEPASGLLPLSIETDVPQAAAPSSP